MPAQSQLERRFHVGALEVRAGSGGAPRIVGLAAPFGVETRITGYAPFREVIRPGAFARAIAERQDVRALFNHEPSTVFARTANGTLTLREEADGLHFEASPIDTPSTAELLARIQRGDVSGCSFMFRIKEQRWTFNEDDEANDLREILDVDLFDVGPVTFPAYQSTSVGARAADYARETGRRALRLQSRVDRLLRGK